MNRTKVAYGLLVLMLLAFVARVFIPLHDLYAVPFLLAGVGAVVLGRGWKGWVLGVAFVSVAVYWSSYDPHGCSTWWRARYVAEKAVGSQPYLSWDDVGFAAFGSGHCYDYETKQAELTRPIELLAEDEVDGQPFQQFRTQLLSLAKQSDTFLGYVRLCMYGKYKRRTAGFRGPGEAPFQSDPVGRARL